jgi:hypothetical protein
VVSYYAPEIADDALPRHAILADRLDQVDVGVTADALLAVEHGASIRSGADSSRKKRELSFEFSTTTAAAQCSLRRLH